jgi:hypothetical protein
MTTCGSLRQTYGAALRLGEISPDPDDLVVAVGPRSPDEHERLDAATATDVETGLAPPTQLRFDLDRAVDRYGPEAAWDAVAYESRYRAFLASDTDARAGLARIRRHLQQGGTVWLVCPGNTPVERRHRAILADVLDEPVRDDGGSTVE